MSNEFGATVKIWLIKRGMKQAELAEALDVSRAYLSITLAGRKNATPKIVSAISKVLQLSEYEHKRLCRVAIEDALARKLAGMAKIFGVKYKKVSINIQY